MTWALLINVTSSLLLLHLCETQEGPEIVQTAGAGRGASGSGDGGPGKKVWVPACTQGTCFKNI